MTPEHKVIVIPGLGGPNIILSPAVNLWRHHGLNPIIHDVHWHDGEDFSPKLQRIIKLANDLSKTNKVSIVGTSAGGSAALNAYMSGNIYKAVNICGRLRVGPHTGIHSFESRTTTSPAFAQSVRLFESREHLLTAKDRQNILTHHAWGFDELVPANTTTIDGATNLVVPVPEHMLSISAALTIFSRPLLTFLTS